MGANAREIAMKDEAGREVEAADIGVRVPHYGDPEVRRRMVDFLGGVSLRTATAVFIQGTHLGADQLTPPLPPAELHSLLDASCEIARSLWDRRSLLVDVDVEYVNFDFPGEVYLEPERSFALQRPVVERFQELLGEAGIFPLHLLTGRGHHFLWTVSRESPAFRRLAALGRVAPPLAAAYAARHPPWKVRVDVPLGLAFAGLGLVMEHLGHRVRDDVSERCSVPVELGEIRVGPSRRGLEMVVIDLSEYGDALHTRRVTLPFSCYLKPRRRAALVGEHVERNLEPISVIPDPGTSEAEALQVMRGWEDARRLAREASTTIPEHAGGMEELIAAYESSELARVHRHFYEEDHELPSRWPETYDRLTFDDLPAEAAGALARPNDLLLQPAGLLAVVRALLERGWHPRHIAGLVRSKYERDHGWGARWYLDSATARADYYVRLFTGMILLERDPLAPGRWSDST